MALSPTSRPLLATLLRESAQTQDKLSARERRQLSRAISSERILGGNEKVEKLGQALRVLSDALSRVGFQLDMVAADILLGDKGSRALPFRRSLPDGSDYFAEGQAIKDSRISFNWENLNGSSDPAREFDPKRFEIVAYLT